MEMLESTVDAVKEGGQFIINLHCSKSQKLEVKLSQVCHESGQDTSNLTEFDQVKSNQVKIRQIRRSLIKQSRIRSRYVKIARFSSDKVKSGHFGSRSTKVESVKMC